MMEACQCDHQGPWITGLKLSLSYNKCFISFFFTFGQILFNLARMFAAQQEKRFVPCVFFKVSTDHLFDNLESGKRNYCFGKKVGKKSWILGPTNLYEPCNNAFVGALFALCRRGIQPPLNARVVFRIIIVLIFFNKLHCCTPRAIFQ